MRKVVMYFILLFILIASSSCVTTSKPVHVIITAGQSNTDGRTSNKGHILIAGLHRMIRTENSSLFGLELREVSEITCGPMML